MTTTEITTEIETLQARIRTLVGGQADLTQQLSRGKSRAAAGMAAGNPADAKLRSANRETAESLDEVTLAIDMFNKDLAQLDDQMKKATIVEAKEELDRLRDAAMSADIAVATAFDVFIEEFFPLVDIAKSKMIAARNADHRVDELEGRKRPAMEQEIRFERRVQLAIDALQASLRESSNEAAMAASLASRS